MSEQQFAEQARQAKLEWLEPTFEVLQDPQSGAVMLPAEGVTHYGNVSYGPS